jgi:hypothetical protein
MRVRVAVAVTVAAVGLTVGLAAVPASAATGGNPSVQCSTTGNGEVSHGGCTSTAARFGSADLENLPYLSTSAFVSNCKGLPGLFLQMVPPIESGIYPVTIGTHVLATPAAAADYIFHDIFGPNMSTCVVVLAADHATIANPGPDGPYDVYYTGGNGGNTTFAPGIPPDLVPIFGGE